MSSHGQGLATQLQHRRSLQRNTPGRVNPAGARARERISRLASPRSRPLWGLGIAFQFNCGNAL